MAKKLNKASKRVSEREKQRIAKEIGKATFRDCRARGLSKEEAKLWQKIFYEAYAE